MPIKLLKVLGWVAGLWLIGIGIHRILFSISTLPGSGSISPTVDSEARVGGALFISFGLAYLWAVRRSPIPVQTVRLLAFTMALIGLARLNSMAETGLPHLAVALTTVVDFTAAGLTYWYSTLSDGPDDDDEPDPRQH